MSSLNLAMEFRNQARVFREHAQESVAIAYERCAQRLEELERSEAEQLLTLAAAAEESGYSYSTLQQKVAAGEIPNLGERGKPRVRRGDLPRRAPLRKPSPQAGEPDLAADVLAARS